MDEQAFVTLLEHVLTPDTNIVKAATHALRQDYYTKPESLLALLHVVTAHSNPQFRQLAAVEARSLVPKFWGGKKGPKVAPELKQQIRDTLLQSTIAEENSLVRHSSARVISAIAKIDLANGEWTNLPQFLSHAATSAKATDREVGVYILYTLLETLEEAVSDRSQEFFALFSQTINDQESAAVRLNTLLALGKMAEYLVGDQDPLAVNAFRNVLPQMVNVLKDLVNNNDEEKANQAFEVFQTLLIVDPALTANHFKDLVQFMIELASAKNVSDDFRSKAISFLLSCLRYKRMKMQAMKFGEQLTLRALEIVTEFKEEDDADDMNPSRSALSLLDYLSASLPPSQVIVPLLKVLPSYVQSPSPEYRKAAVLGLGMCVEGAPEFVATQIHFILPTVLNLLVDPELKVRQAALHTIARLADDLPEEIGKEHSKLIPAFISLLDSSDGLDIWKATCNAVDAVFVGIDKEEVANYLPELMPRLSRMFQQEDLNLKGAAVAAIGSTASSAKDLFMPYFQDTMGALLPFAHGKNSEAELDLRGIIMDAMTGISESVGREAFTSFVTNLMDAAYEALNLGHPRLKETSFMFFSAMARVYEEDFGPFMEKVLNSLFESLDQEETDMDDDEINEALQVTSVGASGSSKAPVESVVIDLSGSGDEEDMDEEDVWDELTAVNAVALEKEVAAEVMGEVLANCPRGYLPYLSKTVDILTQKLQHPYEGVRKAAVSTLWRAYTTFWTFSEEQGQMQKWVPGLPLAVQPTEDLMNFGALVMTATVKLLKDEHDRSTVTEICRNIAETLKLCGPAIISASQAVEEICAQIQIILRKQHTCQLDLEEEEEEEQPDLQESAEYDWILIDTAMDVSLGLAAALGPAYRELFTLFEKPILKYASSSESTERNTSVGVIADSIRYMEASCTQYTPQLMKVLLHRLSDEDPETKSNAAYAVGLLCLKSQNAQETLKYYNTILQKLEPLLQIQHHRLLDNACGCLARMIMAHPEAIPISDVLPQLVQQLPLKEDFDENAPIYEMFVQLYKASNQVVFNLTPQLALVFAQVLSPPKEQLNPETRRQLVELIKFIHSKDTSVLASYPNLVQIASS
ncbi:ARM repeat-containing protein [Terfezia boudieri ATCC MYA-4762]|uniref:ARM repeat-containing protein n=1 Tax=Terfezia boudieri ATCC MYA-4762 TaxID=1051890 RepID=A0A3N4LT68_9PEZI|nr:ARM repeat-containing protein [Terfezia boudieri ATCC MYA-4762]